LTEDTFAGPVELCHIIWKLGWLVVKYILHILEPSLKKGFKSPIDMMRRDNGVI
jgi:hypothetical protein